MTSHQCVGNEQVILDYFETNYIGEFRIQRRIPLHRLSMPGAQIEYVRGYMSVVYVRGLFV